MPMPAQTPTHVPPVGEEPTWLTHAATMVDQDLKTLARKFPTTMTITNGKLRVKR